MTSSLDYSWVAKVINIARPRLPEIKTSPGDTPKEAGPETNTKPNAWIKKSLNVLLCFHPDRKAKIRIPELSSDLLSFKAFLQSQVPFPSILDRKNQSWTGPKSIRQVQKGLGRKTVRNLLGQIQSKFVIYLGWRLVQRKIWPLIFGCHLNRAQIKCQKKSWRIRGQFFKRRLQKCRTFSQVTCKFFINFRAHLDTLFQMTGSKTKMTPTIW